MSEAPPPAADLFAQASAAWDQGRPEAAASLLETLLERQPDHLQGLNALAMIALGRGDAVTAIPLLERAAAAAPEAAALRFNLFQAFDLAGHADAAMASLDRALAVDPYFVPAVLMKADLLARLGRRAEALTMFRAILAVEPDPAALSPPVQAALARGRALLDAEAARHEAAFAAPLAALREAFPDADFSRAEAYAAQRTGRRKVYQQQPVNGHFPYLPALEFFPEEHFPWFTALERRTEEIRRELLALLAGGGEGEFRPYIAFDPTQPVNQWAELNHSRRWSAWFFWEDGVRQDANCARCPATAAMLEALPLLDIPGKGPTALFSILNAHSRIPPHTGSDNVRATVHLPLVVPEGCGFRVGAETRIPAPGRAWAFDDTIEHEAWNDGDEPRAILIFDIWNPLLSEAERAAVRAIG
ncbi:MAG: aspartyl/asparaginyl beta-hydroxylase domain-containing protein [Sphingomonadaceae bacterium]|nr:aspartyl/asparaginyl beta-hydroxylase domain-containing protein [Sphingomonadaceae bacterium]